MEKDKVICAKCRFYAGGNDCYFDSKEWTNYITGETGYSPRSCAYHNCNGECKDFQARPKIKTLWGTPRESDYWWDWKGQRWYYNVCRLVW